MQQPILAMLLAMRTTPNVKLTVVLHSMLWRTCSTKTVGSQRSYVVNLSLPQVRTCAFLYLYMQE